MNNLIPLLPGSIVTIGRKPSCNVVVDSILVSNLHCKLSITSEPPFKATVRDLSRNGTWIKRYSRDDCNGTTASSTNKSPPAHRSEKLPSRGDAKELCVGDSIMLLAPGHKSAAVCKYVLTCGEGGKLFLERPSCSDVSDAATASKTKRKKSEGESGAVSAKKRKLESDGGAPLSKPSTSALTEDDEMGRCPTCRKLFHVSVLPIHCPACQEPSSHKHLKDTVTMEECVFCMQIFPAVELDAHHEVCKGDNVKRDIESYGECPNCSTVLPINELIEHSAKCGKARVPQATPIHSATASAAYEEMEVDGTKILVNAAGAAKSKPTAGGGGAKSYPTADGDASPMELEQCAFCLEDFPLCEMPAHYPVCASNKSKVREHVSHVQ